jgi:hypothetical protein
MTKSPVKELLILDGMLHVVIEYSLPELLSKLMRIQKRE